MTHTVYLLAGGMTQFKRWPKKTHTELAQEAIELTLADSQWQPQITQALDAIYFGNCGMQYWEQSNIKGQVCLQPLIASQLLPSHRPIFNIEGGCATGALAFHQAVQSIQSGQAHVSLAIGVEKTFITHDVTKIPELFASGTDLWHQEQQQQVYQSCAQDLEIQFAPHPKRSVLLDITSLQAQAHQKQYGTTLEQIARVAVKSHQHGSLNPKAQYQKEMSIQSVLEDHAVIYPFTRAMCAPISDGAAAAIVISHEYFKQLPAAVQHRCIPVHACAVSSGSLSDWQSTGPTSYAAQKAYQQAGISAQEIAFAEIHDANAYAELIALESLGLCEAGQAAHWTEQGKTSLGGELPINLSGGLISKGHPLAASGIAMLYEIMCQFRGEAGARNIKNIEDASYALAHNAGGMIGFQEANSVVTILGHRLSI